MTAHTAPALTHARLGQALRRAVLDQHFEALLEPASVGGDVSGGVSLSDGPVAAPQLLRHFPSIDLAVIAYPRNAAPVWANVLFSRECPQGHLASIDANAGDVQNVRFLADQQDEHGNSVAWASASDWNLMEWQLLGGPRQAVQPEQWPAAPRFVAPYPASLVKLMFAVALARAVDLGLASWEQPWRHGKASATVAQWGESMVIASNNEATSAVVALLHSVGLLPAPNQTAQHEHPVHAWFERFGLLTLRITNTRADGGWRNAQGAGVGQLQMTAWDTARLLWLLMWDAPAPPWLAAKGANPAEFLSVPSRQVVWGWLADQGLHEILSSTALAGVPGWQGGIAATLPQRWVQHDGSVVVQDKHFPADVRGTNSLQTVQFAHKTGTTENYVADAGRVQAQAPHCRRYLIAMTSNLGRRFAANSFCATDWRVPKLGAEIDAWLAAALETGSA